MNKESKNDKKLSRLDWLWENYNGGGNAQGITQLIYRDHPEDTNKVQLVGLSSEGEELAVVDMPKEVHVYQVKTRLITQDDIDAGSQYPVGTLVLSIVLTNGEELLTSLPSGSTGLVLDTYFLIKALDDELIGKYPPRKVDGNSYNSEDPQLVLQKPYFVLVYKDIDSYDLYYDYISISPILNTIELSENEGNLLQKDENGYLYSNLNWQEL